MAEIAVLQDVLIALALGALVGMERERVPERKYAGLRTLSLFCAAGPLAVLASTAAGSIAPVAIYAVMGAVFALLVVYLRMQLEGEDLGLTTSATVFLMTLVGILVGYGYRFEAVAVTLFTVLLLTEKKTLHSFTDRLNTEELSDAVKLGILAFVLYPVLPAGAVDPYNVLFLRKALLFVIFILLVQFAGYVSLQWWEDRTSFLLSAALGGVASSLATVTAMTQYVRDQELAEEAYAGATAAVAGSVTRNLFIAATLVPLAAERLYLPFAAAILIAATFSLYYYRRIDDDVDIEVAGTSPFSFRSAFKFGVLFLVILMASELAQNAVPGGVYLTALLGGVGSSTAVVASAATLAAAGTVTAQGAATMIALGVIGSLLSKLVYTELGDARPLTRRIVLPYLLMCGAVLLVAL